MRPAADVALDQGMTYHQAQRAFMLTYLAVAIERSNGVQKDAAKLVKISAANLSRLINGKGLPETTKRGRWPRAVRTAGNLTVAALAKKIGGSA